MAIVTGMDIAIGIMTIGCVIIPAIAILGITTTGCRRVTTSHIVTDGFSAGRSCPAHTLRILDASALSALQRF
jgi:hypothetical protein